MVVKIFVWLDRQIAWIEATLLASLVFKADTSNVRAKLEAADKSLDRSHRHVWIERDYLRFKLVSFCVSMFEKRRNKSVAELALN